MLQDSQVDLEETAMAIHREILVVVTRDLLAEVADHRETVHPAAMDQAVAEAAEEALQAAAEVHQVALQMTHPAALAYRLVLDQNGSSLVLDTTRRLAYHLYQ